MLAAGERRSADKIEEQSTMSYKIIPALAFSLSLGTAAVAQTMDTDIEAGAEAGLAAELPAGWEGEIAGAFFEDEELGILRDESEARANFEALGEEQQAQVRAHCATVDTAAADLPPTPDIETEPGADVAQEPDLDDLGDSAAADLETAPDTEVEPGAEMAQEPDLDDDFDDTAAEAEIDTDIDDIETGAVDPATGPHHASLVQICEWIDE
jgi:hypothetical protein